jgi:hypothetical protein
MTYQNQPIKRKIPPPVKPTNQSSTSMFNILSEGITFGIGSSIGHNIVNKFSSFFSSSSSPNNCDELLRKINECKNNYGIAKESWMNDACFDIYEEFIKCK